MIKIIIITHGCLGTEMLKTAELVIGRQADVIVLNLEQSDSLATMINRTGEILEGMDNSQGALILTDMLGGTPCNAALSFAATHNVEIISGLNLYMLISALMNRGIIPLNELALKVQNDGKKNIANAKEIFLKKLQ